MSMQEMTAVISRFQAATDVLAALGARLGMSEGDTVAPEILAALDEVLVAAGVTDVDGLEPAAARDDGGPGPDHVRAVG